MKCSLIRPSVKNVNCRLEMHLVVVFVKPHLKLARSASFHGYVDFLPTEEGQIGFPE